MEAGNSTAFTNTCIAADVLPSKFKDVFARGLFSPKQWINKFTEANYIVAISTQSESDEEEDEEKYRQSKAAGAPTKYDTSFVDRDAMSRDLSMDTGSDFGEEEFARVEFEGLGEVESEEEWAYTVRAQRAALE
jgi:hypothetical protein